MSKVAYNYCPRHKEIDPDCLRCEESKECGGRDRVAPPKKTTFVFKQGNFTMQIPAYNEAEARELLPDTVDYGTWDLVEPKNETHDGSTMGTVYTPNLNIPIGLCSVCGEDTYTCQKCGKHPCPNCSPLQESPWGQTCPFCSHLMNVYIDPPSDMDRDEWEIGFKKKSPENYDLYVVRGMYGGKDPHPEITGGTEE